MDLRHRDQEIKQPPTLRLYPWIIVERKCDAVITLIWILFKKFWYLYPVVALGGKLVEQPPTWSDTKPENDIILQFNKMHGYATHFPHTLIQWTHNCSPHLPDLLPNFLFYMLSVWAAMCVLLGPISLSCLVMHSERGLRCWKAVLDQVPSSPTNTQEEKNDLLSV